MVLHVGLELASELASQFIRTPLGGDSRVKDCVDVLNTDVYGPAEKQAVRSGF
jgi:hypothetical protein